MYNEGDCPLNLCDTKFACMDFQNTNGSDDTWKIVAFTLIGSITSILAVGLLKLLRSWLSKRCKQENIVFNGSQTGMDNLTPNENHMEENKYEEHRSSPSYDEIEAEHPYNIFVENNYADLRTSDFSPIYDNPGDFETEIISAR